MNFRSGVKVYFPLFIALAKDDAFAVFKIHIIAVELYKFADTDAGSCLLYTSLGIKKCAIVVGV